MEQPFSTSKVTVEYFDPDGVYKLLAPGLVPRLPLRNLHWQSHAGPLRSIDTLHIELVPAGETPSITSPISSPPPSNLRLDNDGFQTQVGAGPAAAPSTQSTDNIDQVANRNSLPARRHQIPGLRRTPYLKVLLVRCDDNDSYKGHVRQEIRDWIKTNIPLSGSKKTNTAENHDACEWLVVHVVIPNTAAATQPRKSESGTGSERSSAASRWRTGSSTLLEKLRSDFNSSGKGAVDRIAQIRIGVNDVPYDILPRVVPAVPSGYTETEQDTENAWTDLIVKFRGLILSSFDLRVSQYEEDIKEKDAQRALPGWNFCTFFILKEGLARGFESVGLVEDALVGYDELSVGLDMVVKEEAQGDAGSAANALLSYTDELKQIAFKAGAAIRGETYGEDDEVVDLQSLQPSAAQTQDPYDDIPISSNKKPYRDMIVGNNVSVFDFRCYIFARQIALLSRLGNAGSSREELLAKLKEQQESIIHGVAPRAPAPKHKENEHENLSMLAEICRRTLEFIPLVSQVMRKDVFNALSDAVKSSEDALTIDLQNDLIVSEVVDNLVASFAFSIAQQILAQTSTKALPIPPSTLAPLDGHEPKAVIPEPKTMMHPARTSSLSIRPGRGANVGPGPPSPNVFPGRRRDVNEHEGTTSTFLKAGLEELAARRAELYGLSRNILEECGKKRGWDDGWSTVPVIGESTMVDLVEINLNEDPHGQGRAELPHEEENAVLSVAGIDSKLLRTALDNAQDFYRLYEILTDKALRHYTVASHTHSIQASMADIAVLKYHLGDYSSAASSFWRTTPFFGESGWSLLELSMLVMYSRCLKALGRREECVKVLLKLLSKAAVAERDRQHVAPSFGIGKKPDVQYPEKETMAGFLGDLLDEAKELTRELQMPLSSFFFSAAVDGPPKYHEGRDSFSVNISLKSLLFDNLDVTQAKVRIVSTSSRPTSEIWLDLEKSATIRPGNNKLELRSHTAIPGSYVVDKIDLIAGNLRLHYERDTNHPWDRTTDLVKSPFVQIFQRTDTLDVQLHASKHIQLDHNSLVEVGIDSGWNEIRNAEVRVKAATGGLRLLTSEANCVDSSAEFSKSPQGGVFYLESIPQRTALKIRFPYTMEQETHSVSIRIDVSYETQHGTFTFSKTPSINTTLALGVNVQDVFKHKALFSRFTVSTASNSPIGLFKSELLGSDIYESEFGVPPCDSVVIFPRQPASFLYKVSRKTGGKAGPKRHKTLHLKLHYTVIHDEIEALFEKSVIETLEASPLRIYSRLVLSTMLPHVRNFFGGLELERATLLGSVPTSFLAPIEWSMYFAGLGRDSDGVDVARTLSSFLQTWQESNPNLALMDLTDTTPKTGLTSILIPVDIPSVTIVHTADIRRQPQQPITSNTGQRNLLDEAVVCTNQLLPAALHLKWTRIWDTVTPPSEMTDLEFSYEINAPQDTWLLGGRRRGHFVIPAPDLSSSSGSAIGLSSTVDTEAEIPILMIPLREGYLPYPNVDIREVRTSDLSVATTPGGSGSGGGQTPIEGPITPGAAKGMMLGGDGEAGEIGSSQHTFETDFRNLGETVRVITDRNRVTLSLDASGPGGGPLVLEVEKRGDDGVLDARVLIA